MKKDTTQSSTEDNGNSSLAVDGNRENTCTQQRNVRNPWWEVDLDGIYTVDEVVVTQIPCEKNCSK